MVLHRFQTNLVQLVRLFGLVIFTLPIIELLFIPVVSAGERIARSFEVADIERQRTVIAHIYVPDKLGHDARILVVMHGTSRTAKRYLRTWKRLADTNGVVLLAPEFSKKDWPNSRHYNLGNIFTAKRKTSKPRSLWSFSAMEKAVKITSKIAGVNGERFFLYGHSAGGQFVHRYVMLTGGKKLIRAVAANAGWYLWPDENKKFPYGLRLLENQNWDWKAVFRTDLTVLVGSDDNDSAGKTLRTKKGAMVQGKHRLQRAVNFFLAAREYADEQEQKFRWRLQTVPGVGHSNRGMSVGAAKIFFNK